MKNIFRSLSIILLTAPIISCSQSPKTTPNTKTDGALIWSDEFDGTEVNTGTWNFQTGDHGWGNGELQNYTPFGSGTATVSDGYLHITTRLVGEGQKVGDYESARINSKESFLYGRIEIRAKIPDYKGPGLWPALWMLGENIRSVGWPTSGEIDIMEYVSRKPDSLLATIHSRVNNHIDGTQISTGFIPLPTIEEEFHNYGLIWEEDKLSFYIDEVDNLVLEIPRPEHPTQENWPFSNPHYFLLNMAVGGNLGGEEIDDSIFPATMLVDYVRVYNLEDK